MNPVDILRSVTKPKTDAEVEIEHWQRFGSMYERESIGLDEPGLAAEIATRVARQELRERVAAIAQKE